MGAVERVEINKMFPLLSKFSIKDIKAHFDITGAVILEIVYKAPYLQKGKSEFLSAIRLYDIKEIRENDMRVYPYAIGWGDAMCKTYSFGIMIKPLNINAQL